MEWVSIKEKLPECKPTGSQGWLNVIIASWNHQKKEWHVGPASYREGKFYDAMDEEIFLDDGYWELTHWQYSPPPPGSEVKALHEYGDIYPVSKL